MLKFVIVSCAFLALAIASPIGGYHHYEEPVHYQPSYDDHHHESPDKHAQIVKSEDQRGKDGSYAFKFETENGITAHEQGHTKNAGHKDHETQQVEGYYSYTDKHGKKIEVHYKADEHGFHAEGEHLPTPPPIPKEIQESLAKNAAEGHHEDEGQHYQHQPEYHHQPSYHQHY